MKITISGKVKTFVGFVLCAAIFLSISTGCSIENGSVFPEISYDNSFRDLPVQNGDENDETKPNGDIRVALPYSEECIEYLGKLFTGKNTGLFRTNFQDKTSLTISLEDLDEYDSEINLIGVESDYKGMDLSEIEVMKSAGNLPDIFLVRSLYINKEDRNLFADLSGSYLDGLLDPKEIYTGMFYDDPKTKEILALPYYARIAMMYINRNILDGFEIDPLVFDYPVSFEAVFEVSRTISLQDPETYVWADFLKLSAFLPGTIKPFPKSYMYSKNVMDFDNSAFADSISLLRSLNESSNVAERVSRDYTDVLFDGQDPVINGEICFWIEYSDKINEYEQNENLNLARYPIPVVDNISLPLSVVGIAVNPDSESLQTSKRIAAFLALDKDAFLFKSRYPLPNGYVPPINDITVWENFVLKQIRGDDLFVLREDLKNKVPMESRHGITPHEVYSILYDEYIYDLINDTDMEISEIISILNSEAVKFFD